MYERDYLHIHAHERNNPHQLQDRQLHQNPRFLKLLNSLLARDGVVLSIYFYDNEDIKAKSKSLASC